jgi:hypothetical protein
MQVKRTFFLNNTPDGLQVAELIGGNFPETAMRKRIVFDQYQIISVTVDADDIRIIDGEFWYDWNLFTPRELDYCALDSFATAHCAHIYHVCRILGIEMPSSDTDYQVNVRTYREVMAQGFERFKEIAHFTEYFGGVQLYGTGTIIKGITDCGTKVFSYHSDNNFSTKNAVDALSHTGVERWIYAFMELHKTNPKMTINTSTDDSDAVDLKIREVAP